MKFAKTFCKPNSCVTIVPVGLPVVLQYNEHGVLQKVLVGFSDKPDGTPQGTYTFADQEKYSKFFDQVCSRVPTILSTKGGTTWVYGVLYSSIIPTDEGVLPDSLIESYINNLLNDVTFTFYAGYVHSLAASFQGAVVIRNFLNGAGFNVLPQVIVPVSLTKETIEAALSHGPVLFSADYLAGFFVFEGLQCRYLPLDLEQVTAVADPKLEIGEDGFWKGTVEAESGRKITFSYSAIIRHVVEKGTTLLLQRESAGYAILDTRIGTAAQIIPLDMGKEIKCPVCGKLCKVGTDDSPFQCDDPNCMSHSYQDAVKMLRFLDLEELSYEDYRAALDKKDLQCLTDVLELPQYKDLEINAMLANAMSAVIPASVAPNFDVVERFANKCNNSIDTVKYYLNSPLRIETDLDIIDPMVAKLAKWLEDPYNVTTLDTIFDRVNIIATTEKFDGTPIFRGNKIAVTGKFKRGDLNEIESILRSFKAEVVSSIEPGEDLPDVVVMGGLNDGVSGQMIQKARAHGIPIQDEDDFFSYYELDQDMAENLL